MKLGGLYVSLRDVLILLRLLDNVNKIEKSLDELSINKTRLTEENSALNPDKTKEYIEKYDKLLRKQSEIGNEMNTLQLDVARNNSAIVGFEHDIKDLLDQQNFL